MKRFAQSFLTIATILIVLANLTLVILYGRQFSFHATETLACVGVTCSGRSLVNDFAILNGLLIAFLLMSWYTAVKIFQAQSRN